MTKYYALVKLYDEHGKMTADVGDIIELEDAPAKRHLERGNVRKTKTRTRAWKSEVIDGDSNGTGTEQQNSG